MTNEVTGADLAILPCAIWIGLWLSLVPARGTAEEVEVSTGGFSSSWTPDEWTVSESSSDITRYAKRPDEQTLKAVTVEWQRPALDALGNFCTIRGRLVVPAGENG